MAAFDEARNQLADALVAWDFSPVFPSSYTGNKGVLVVPQFPYETIDNMLNEQPNFGQMTMPIISIILGHATDTFRSLGDHDFGASQIPVPSGKQRYGTRVGLAYMVSSWADQFLGGYETVEKLAGQVQACVFVNRRSLTAFRHLRTYMSEGVYEDRPELYTLDCHVEGDALVSYDL